MSSHEENVRRLYPQLFEIVKDEDVAAAGVALCATLTILAFRENYALEALLYMTRDSIRKGWAELHEWGLPPEVAPLLNGEIKEEEDGET